MIVTRAKFKSMFLVIVFACVTSIAGCNTVTTTHTFVEIESESHTVTMDGMNVPVSSYSPTDLDRLAKEYVQSNNLGFNFEGCSLTVRVPRSREYLADLSYIPEQSGAKGLFARVGFDGSIQSHQIMTVLSCGFDVPK